MKYSHAYCMAPKNGSKNNNKNAAAKCLTSCRANKLSITSQAAGTLTSCRASHNLLSLSLYVVAELSQAAEPLTSCQAPHKLVSPSQAVVYEQHHRRFIRKKPELCSPINWPRFFKTVSNLEGRNSRSKLPVHHSPLLWNT